MYCDSITLEQLRVFVLVVEEGSFSAAAKKLNRAQSAVSYSIATLEELLEFTLFDRSFRKPRLTESGHKLLGQAREVLLQMVRFQEEAKKIVCQEETDIFLVVDLVFPPTLLAQMCSNFQKEFPEIRLHLHTVLLEEVSALVVSGDFHLGICVSRIERHPALVQHSVFPFKMLSVAHKDHPLAQRCGMLKQEDIESHIQVVVSSSPAKELKKTLNVFGKENWRVTNFTTKKELFLAGVGWGGIPAYMVQDEIKSGELVALSLDPSLYPVFDASFCVIRRQDVILGKGGRWIWEYLSRLTASP